MENVNKIRMVWMESPETRLHEWREFRQSLDGIPLSQACDDVRLWWGLAPQTNISIDPYDINTWPNPWNMVHQGDVCKFSSAIGMSYTLFYMDNTIPNVVMRVNDILSGDFYMVCLIDNNWVLNYDTCDIAQWSDVKDTLEVQESWTCADIVNNVR